MILVNRNIGFSFFLIDLTRIFFTDFLYNYFRVDRELLRNDLVIVDAVKSSKNVI
jgi:hypothetical protein